jgi:hypothetical protein
MKLATKTSAHRGRRVAMALAALAIVAATSGIATPQDKAQPTPHMPGSPQTVPEKIALAPCAQRTEAAPPSAHETLSEKLDRSGGVITPPKGIDPGIAVPPPDTQARMPVIPPPGCPGGEKGIEPK